MNDGEGCCRLAVNYVETRMMMKEGISYSEVQSQKMIQKTGFVEVGWFVLVHMYCPGPKTFLVVMSCVSMSSSSVMSFNVNVNRGRNTFLISGFLYEKYERTTKMRLTPLL